jgi:hypothetical protein
VHTVTITAHPTARAGVGPHTILPGVARPGAGIRPASCGQQTITCWVEAPAPFVRNRTIGAGGRVWCDHPVARISMEEDLFLLDTSRLAGSTTRIRPAPTR